jgi:Holliday junction resolvasome RuvABC endonuclease subunit
MKFISVDPSLSNTAIVWGEIVDGKIIPIGYKLAHSEKGKDKKVAVMEDRVSRIRSIFTMIDEVLSMYPPDICAFEYSSGSQSSAGAISVGVSCAIAAKLPLPSLGVTPMEVKKVIGKGVISKVDVMNYCETKYPDFPYERKKDGTMVLGKMEHVADAIIIMEAGLKKLNK